MHGTPHVGVPTLYTCTYHTTRIVYIRRTLEKKNICTMHGAPHVEVRTLSGVLISSMGVVLQFGVERVVLLHCKTLL